MRINVLAVAAALVVCAAATAADARPTREVDGGDHWNPFVQRSSSVAESRRRDASETRSLKRSKLAQRSKHAQRTKVALRAQKRVRYASRGADDSYGSGTSYETTSYSRGSHSAGGRPRAWCGWWMRTQRGGGPEMNLAWNWSRWGHASSPQVGAVVVWRHHVGEIVGRAANGQWLVRSGNDGGAVRTRARSISGAVVRMG
jgi:uncharacterized protein YxeA